MKIQPVSSQNAPNPTFSPNAIQNKFIYDASSIQSHGKSKFCGSIKSCLLFFPRMLFSILKKLVYLFSCCTLCRSTLSNDEKIMVLRGILKVWENPTSSEEAKKEAWAKVTSEYPYLEQEIIEAYVKGERDAKLAFKKDNREKILEWDVKNRESCERTIKNKLAKWDKGALKSHIDYLTPPVLIMG